LLNQQGRPGVKLGLVTESQSWTFRTFLV